MENLFKSDVLKEAYDVGKENWLSVEGDAEYTVGRFRSVGKLDFAYRRRNGKVRIVDWKTGLKVGETNQRQVDGYALHAMNAGWAKDPTEIETVLMYLAIPKEVHAQITQNTLEQTKVVIQAQSIAMNLKVKDDSARMEDWHLTGQKWACKRCQFRKVCYPNWENAEKQLAFR
jgi:CRISPR/Cas system-associated exonuclease Cas4 (RecB family)